MSPAATAVAVSDLSPAHSFLHRSSPFFSFPFLDPESDSKDGDDNNLSLPFSFLLSVPHLRLRLRQGLHGNCHRPISRRGESERGRRGIRLMCTPPNEMTPILLLLAKWDLSRAKEAYPIQLARFVSRYRAAVSPQSFSLDYCDSSLFKRSVSLANQHPKQNLQLYGINGEYVRFD